MAWSIPDFLGQMREQMDDLFGTFGDEAGNGGLVALITPVDPFNRSDILSPLISVAGMISVLILSGIVVGALAVALAGFLAVCFVLAEVFGYELNMAVPTPAA